MNKNNLLIGGVIIAIVLSVVSLSKTPAQGPAGKDGKNIVTYGATPGQDFDGQRISINGVGTNYFSPSYQAATSTLCTIKTGSATSTLRSFTAKPTTATSTTVLVVLENRGTNPYPPILSAATTTNVFASYNIASGAVSEFVYQATSTSVVGRNDVFAPGTYLSFYAKNGGGGSVPQAIGSSVWAGGRCTAEFREI